LCLVACAYRHGPNGHSAASNADPQELLDHACRLGLEGIVGKDCDSSYRSGRTGDWVKIKCVQSEGFFIVGYEPSSSSPFSSLLLAAYRSDQLEYVGSVGTGFTARQVSELRTMMNRLTWKWKTPPVP